MATWSAESAGLTASIISIVRFGVCLRVSIDGSAPISAPFPTTTPRTERDVRFVAAAKFHDATATPKTDTDVRSAPTRFKDVAICSSPIFAARRRHCSKSAPTQITKFPIFFQILAPNILIYFKFSTKYQNEDAISASNVIRLSITDTCDADQRPVRLSARDGASISFSCKCGTGVS